MVVGRSGDLVIGQKGRGPFNSALLSVWDPRYSSDDPAPVSVLTTSQSTDFVSDLTLHGLADGRLVAGFGVPGDPTVGGWLHVWRPPLRDDEFERVDLPIQLDVTDLDDDGHYLYVGGSVGTLRIPLDSLPFAESVEPVQDL